MTDILLFYEQRTTIERYLKRKNYAELKTYVYDMHSADIADIIENLDIEDQKIIFGLLESSVIPEVLEELNTEDFDEIIKHFSYEKKLTALDGMSQDEIVDKLSELPELRQDEIISYLDYSDAEDVRELLIYDEDTAGGIMTKDFVAIKKDYSIYYAIETLRAMAPEAEIIYYVYVTDQKDKLVGVISLRELLVSKPTEKVEDIMSQKIICVKVDDDQEEVAQVVSKYDLLAVPVVDEDNILLGIITIDDILDVIEEEATEDIYKFVGASDEEDYEIEDSIGERISGSVKSRLPWLIVTIFGGLLSSIVIGKYSSTLSANATLSLFMPLLTGMGGNVGTQSSTITVRNIATGNLEGNEIYKAILHEISVGFIVGLVCSLVAGTAAALISGDVLMGIVVLISLWANILAAATIGTLVPITFRKIGVDPAVASAPFITTTIDVIGLSIYFSLATILIVNLS